MRNGYVHRTIGGPAGIGATDGGGVDPPISTRIPIGKELFMVPVDNDPLSGSRLVAGHAQGASGSATGGDRVIDRDIHQFIIRRPDTVRTRRNSADDGR